MGKGAGMVDASFGYKGGSIGAFGTYPHGHTNTHEPREKVRDRWKKGR